MKSYDLIPSFVVSCVLPLRELLHLMVSANLVYKFASHDYELPERGEREKTNTFFFFFCGAQNSSNAVSWAFFFFKFKELSLLGFQKMKYDNIRWRVSQHFAYYQPPFFLPLNDACFITCFLSMLNY